MSLQTDYIRTRVLNLWLSRRNNAVNRLNTYNGLKAITLPRYRDDTVGLSQADKDEVVALIALIDSLANTMVQTAGDAAGQAEIDALLLKFNPAKRERTPEHARFLIDMQKTIATDFQSVRLARKDLRQLKADVEADTVNFTAEDAALITANIKSVKDALASIIANDAVAFTAATSALTVH